MKLTTEQYYGPEELTAMLEDCFTVDGTRPVVSFDKDSGRGARITVDFPVPCEPKSQTAFQITLTEALHVCRRGARRPKNGSQN